MTRMILALVVFLALPALLYAQVPGELSRMKGTLLVLKGPQVMPIRGSRINVKFKTAVKLYGRDEVWAGVLADDTTLGVWGDNLNVTFMGGTVALFAPAVSGLKAGVCKGVLGRTQTLNTYRDGKVMAVTIPKGTTVDFQYVPAYPHRTMAVPVK